MLMQAKGEMIEMIRPKSKKKKQQIMPVGVKDALKKFKSEDVFPAMIRVLLMNVWTGDVWTEEYYRSIYENKDWEENEMASGMIDLGKYIADGIGVSDEELKETITAEQVRDYGRKAAKEYAAMYVTYLAEKEKDKEPQ